MVARTLRCCKCRLEKPVEAFSKRPMERHKVVDSLYGLRVASYPNKRGADYSCKECKNARRRELRRQRARPVVHRCGICRTSDLSLFTLRPSGKPAGYCKPCRQLYAKLGSAAAVRASRR